ncbi:MAG: hypothetical protein U0W40_13095 [Acidimicrobiia bacterium]
MTTVTRSLPKTSAPVLPAAAPKATTGFWSWFTTVDHKKIGIMYGAPSLLFFVVAGIEALLIRLQLAARTARCSPRRSTTPCSRCTARR